MRNDGRVVCRLCIGASVLLTAVVVYLAVERRQLANQVSTAVLHMVAIDQRLAAAVRDGDATRLKREVISSLVYDVEFIEEVRGDMPQKWQKSYSLAIANCRGWLEDDFFYPEVPKHVRWDNPETAE